MVRSQRYYVIRERESFEDLVRGERTLGELTETG
jgi:hypothetical protein